MTPQPSANATVRVCLFAALRESAGWSERLVPLPPHDHPPCTPLALWHRLDLPSHWPTTDPGMDQPGHPRLCLPSGLRVAINQRFAAADAHLRPGDELAFLPPITGG